MEYNKIMEGFSASAQDIMLAYAWPGNVRELKNVIRSIVVLHNGKLVLPEHLPPELDKRRKPGECGEKAKFVLPEEGISLDDFERDLILQALERTGRNKTKAAKLLQVSYDSFRYQLKKFGFE